MLKIKILKKVIRKSPKVKKKIDLKKLVIYKTLHARPSLFCFYPLEVLKGTEKFNILKLFKKIILYIVYNGRTISQKRISGFFQEII